MFEHMEIVEEIYEVAAPSQNTKWAETDRVSSGRNKIGGASARHPTSIRYMLESAREAMQAIQYMSR